VLSFLVITRSLNNMEFLPGVIGSLLSGTGPWSARITRTELECRTDHLHTRFAFATITRVQCSTGLVWARLVVSSHSGRVELRGLGNRRARDLSQLLEQRVAGSLLLRLEHHRAELARLWQSYTALQDSPHYLAHADLRRWREASQTAHGAAVRAIANLLRHPFYANHAVSGGLLDRARVLRAALEGYPESLEVRNEEFVRKEMEGFRAFFDSVESTPLTPEQRRASVVMEDRNLLVASAGSGKTSTVVAKVGYALVRRLVTPEEILIVAFNAHAAAELEERIHQRLAPWVDGPVPIKVKTFHAFGLEVITEVEGERPSVAESGDEDRVVGELIEELLATDDEFAAVWIQFHTLYPDEVADPAAFRSAKAWQAHLRNTGESDGGRYGYRTLNGEIAASQGERAIANWLYVHGVEYVYRPAREHAAMLGGRRRARPQFRVPSAGAWVRHSASATTRGRQRVFQVWGRRQSARKENDVLETCFAEYASGEMFPNLQRELAARGAGFRPLPRESILAKARKVRRPQQEETSALIQAFVKHARSSQRSSETVRAAAHAQPCPARAVRFARLADIVRERLADRHRTSGTIDFEDMILRAARYAREGLYRHGFRLILVDEFQDISQARAGLLLGLLEHAPECKLFAVGDDWQSIYRFAGSDISLFTGFAPCFGKSAVNYLTRTFRSNQGIAGVAAHFVQQNGAQMRKEVVAQDKTRKATLVVSRYKRKGDAPRYTEACLAEAAREAASAGERRTVFILGRYRRQAPGQLEIWQAQHRAALEIDYKTIHGSKGLQADYVVLVGLEAGGFPSERADDPLISMVMPEPETHPHAEERRLFYVALTRARHRAYLLGSKRSPSCFLTELARKNPAVGCELRIADKLAGDARRDTLQCPRCGEGRLTLRNGASGRFYG